MADIDYNALGIYFFAEYCFNHNNYSIPLNNGTLDRAMKKVIEENKELRLPLKLSFAESNIGLIKCIELEEMILAAHNSEIIRYTKDHTKCIPSISKTSAEAIIENNKVPNEIRQFSSKVFKKIQNK